MAKYKITFIWEVISRTPRNLFEHLIYLRTLYSLFIMKNAFVSYYFYTIRNSFSVLRQIYFQYPISFQIGEGRKKKWQTKWGSEFKTSSNRFRKLIFFWCRGFFHHVRIVITFVNVNSCKLSCWNVSCTRWRIWLGKIFDRIPTGETRWLKVSQKEKGCVGY